MAEVMEDFVIPPLAPDRPLDLDISYYGYDDRLMISFYSSPRAGMNVPIGDETIELRVSMDESELLGLEIPGFTEVFLLEHPEFLDFAATAGVSTDKIESIRWRISTAQRQRTAIDGLLRQFAGVGFTP